MGTHHRGNEDERRALDAYIKLMRAAESVTASVLPLIADAGLTVGQFGALEALYHLGPLAQHALAEKLLRSSGNVSVVVDNLELAGLVLRRRRSDDRRVVEVSLTIKGRRLMSDLFPRHAAAMTDRMAFLGATQQEELARLCRTLGKGQDVEPATPDAAPDRPPTTKAASTSSRTPVRKPKTKTPA